MANFVSGLLSSRKSQLAIALVAMLLVGVFLPAAAIHYAVIVLGVIGWLVCFIWISKHGLLPFALCVLLLIPAGLFFAAIILVVHPLFIFNLWPTAINIVATCLLVSLLPSSGALKAAAFLPISALLGLNVLLPSLIDDAYLSNTGEVPGSRAIELPADDYLLVDSDIEKLAFYPKKHSALLTIEGNYGCACGHWLQPRLTEENIERALQEEGFRYKLQKGGSGGNRLEVRTDEQLGLTQIEFRLFQDEEEIASYRRQLRNHYPLEPWSVHNALPGAHDLDSIAMRIYFLAQSNVWTLLATSPNRESQFPSPTRKTAKEYFSPFSYFVQRYISRIPNERDSVNALALTLTSKLYVAEAPDSTSKGPDSTDEESSTCPLQASEVAQIETYVNKPGHSLTLMNYRENLLFEFDQIKVLVTTKPLEVGMVRCSGSTYEVVTSPKNHENFFVRQYSMEGNLLVNHKIPLPVQSFEGTYRRIVGLKNTRTTYEIDIADGRDNRVLRTYKVVANKPSSK